jgi:predicted ATPase
MLKSITIENFFSFGKATKIELNAGLNILVGINASGKSTIIKALQLLYETVCGKGYEKLIMEDWGGFEAVRHQGVDKKEIVLSFEFDKNKLNESIISIKEEFQWTTNPYYKIVFNDRDNLTVNDWVFENHNEPFKPLLSTFSNGIILKNIFGEEVKTTHGRNRQVGLKYIIDSVELWNLLSLKNQIEALKPYSIFDTSLKSPIRQPAAYTTENALIATGENLTTILQHIKNYHSLSYEQIETLLQKVNPNFKDISFNTLGTYNILTLREKKLNRTIFAEHISDGTLRFLLLLAITCNPMRGSLVCLDEPDMGLHPDMISTIADTLKEAAKTSQFIISTHSPLLLNEFDLEDIIVIEKDADNQSIAKTFNSDDFAEWSNNYLAGQLWLMGKLGGKRW